MRTEVAVTNLLKSLVLWSVIGICLGLGILQTEHLLNDRKIQRYVLDQQATATQAKIMRDAFDARPFSDFVQYHRIIAAFTPEARAQYLKWRSQGRDAENAFSQAVEDMTVRPGSIIRLISDRDILEVPPGGFRGEWEEFIQCDYGLTDNIPQWEYLAEVSTTGRRYKEVTKRLGPDALASAKGFTLYHKPRQWPEPVSDVPEDERRKIPVRYPDEDADCRLISDMTITFADGTAKQSRLYGNIIRVRGDAL